ncbi:MAG: NAD(P)-dependent oxidoreductase [Candidatus Marinimicrobia bacterium CG_4_10_14_0_2_um_filter_48_9]|nr:MAG: NAD(P)-dependent oxidoreductase [Candidatus Marinimicrobia bacterium CG_4_10_14_0_2_um_filter_48_9]PJA51681.1 MAG: NAD(P)-dependent oxidoreductase [Candidatus Marinimicrobia bacterium CG_4_9_14_3_um_filter_48_9]
MNYSIENQTVFISGASSGIGAATARQFAASGANLILAARRTERLDQLAAELKSNYNIQVHSIKMDVSKIDSVKQGIASLPASFKAIDILINNAGLALGVNKAQVNIPAEIDVVVDVNVKGVLYLIQEITPGMVTRGRGHIINISSIAGHEAYPGGSVYCATKHAVDAITKSTRMDLVDTPLRVTAISPGLVETEFSLVRFQGDTERASKIYQGYEPLIADDIADAILYAATRPPHVQIADMIIFPTAQASATIVHKLPVSL